MSDMEGVSGPDDMDAEEFQEELQDLLQRADREGIEVEGGWDLESRGNSHLWALEITRVENRGDDGE